MVKDNIMQDIESTSAFRSTKHCDKTMENNIEGYQNEPDVKQESKSHKYDGYSNSDVTDMTGIQISVDMGCNYEKELKNDVFTNTDKVSATRNEFYFETDHDALRGNPDYLAVLKTLAVLEAQKVQAVKDLESLQVARNNAVKDPLLLISKLQNGEDLMLPGQQKIAEIPYINWDKYGLASLSQLATFSLRKPETRRNVSTLINQVQSNNVLSDYCQAPEKDKDTGSTSVVPNITPHINKIHHDFGPLESVTGLGCKVERTVDGKQYLVRGRLFDGKTKPKTFNQPWTTDEQRRLEELLHEYPSEDIEMERWKKIAGSLGNRTAIQVQSRVQKYFLKLHKAGLPIPGKLGNKAKAKCKSSNSFNQINGASNYAAMFQAANQNKFVNNLVSQRNSTFFPHLKPDVKMTEEDERHADIAIHFNGGTPLQRNSASSSSADIERSSGDWNIANGTNSETISDNTTSFSKLNGFQLTDNDYYLETEDVSDEEGVLEELRKSPDYEELIWLKRIRREKELEQREGRTHPIKHYGYKCDGCGQDPILGGRFTCVDCAKIDHCVDYCCECAPIASQLKNIGIDFGHTHDHNFRPVRKRVNYMQWKRKYSGNTRDKDYMIEARMGNYLDPNYQYFNGN